MHRDTRLLVRSTLGIAGGLVALLLAQTLLELLADPGAAAVFRFDPAGTAILVSSLNGTFAQYLAIVFTAVAIAVPLTATEYSVKLLELFISDRVNRAVLLLFVFVIPNSLWLQHSLRADHVPRLQLGIALVLAVVCPALLLPYLYYIFRFLHPSTLLRRLALELRREVHAARNPARARGRARAVAALMEHMGGVGIRAVERSDRATAVETVQVLRAAAEAYWAVKPELPERWFSAGAAVSRIDPDEAGTWVEARLLSEMRALLGAAVPQMHDVVAAVADAARAVADSDEARDDEAVEERAVEYFNTFVRLAINRRDVRSVYLLFHRYRDHARAVVSERPERAAEIAYLFVYYARAAHDAGMTFVVETIAHDLAAVVRQAWEVDAPNREALLGRFLSLDREVTPTPLAGVKKAEAILASFFLLRGEDAPVRRIAGDFEGLPRAFLDGVRDEILHVTREKYWEVTDRRVNLDYVPEAQREKVAEFFALLGAPADPVPAHHPDTDDADADTVAEGEPRPAEKS